MLDMPAACVVSSQNINMMLVKPHEKTYVVGPGTLDAFSLIFSRCSFAASVTTSPVTPEVAGCTVITRGK